MTQPILTKDQEDLVIQIWNDNKDNPPSLQELTQKVIELENK